MGRRTSRRHFLAGATGLVGALAGCSGLPGGSGGASRLQYVEVENFHTTEHTLHVLVERNGELVHWSTHQLAGKGSDIDSAKIERTWGNETGQYAVLARVDDAGQWKRIDLDRGGCYGVNLRVNGEQSVEIFFEQNPSGCTSPEPSATK